MRGEDAQGIALSSAEAEAAVARTLCLTCAAEAGNAEAALFWLSRRPELASSTSDFSFASDFMAPEGAARSARPRLWAADVACYYAQRRFRQTGRDADRRIWESCQQETQNALAAVREAERARAK